MLPHTRQTRKSGLNHPGTLLFLEILESSGMYRGQKNIRIFVVVVVAVVVHSLSAKNSEVASP